MILVKSPEELVVMRRACRVVAEVLRRLPGRIRPGVSTGELDAWAEALIREQGGQPAFKGYHGYPATLCTSVNEQVVHGIPGERRLREGDIVSVDVGVKIDGWYGDGAWTYPVGDIDPETEYLLRITRESLEHGIAQAVAGNRVSDIGHAVQTHVEAAGFSVVRDLVGHGVGRELHEDPQIPNYGEAGQGARLKTGMTLAIEPMVNAGSYEVRTLDDQWTVVTRDGRRSAHFEHTVAVGKDGAEVLTV